MSAPAHDDHAAAGATKSGGSLKGALWVVVITCLVSLLIFPDFTSKALLLLSGLGGVFCLLCLFAEGEREDALKGFAICVCIFFPMGLLQKYHGNDRRGEFSLVEEKFWIGMGIFAFIMMIFVGVVFLLKKKAHDDHH